MLLSLTIRNFVIVDALTLDFEAGLTVLSGETGAGKSILIDALALCLGERGEAGMVQEGCTRADITAEFLPHTEVMAWLEQHELSHADKNTQPLSLPAQTPAEPALIVRRTIDSQGKSRAYINQIPVTVASLKNLGALLVDIHGQHAFQSLTKPDEQRRLLDRLGQHGDCLKKTAKYFERLKQLQHQQTELVKNLQTLAQERERLSWQYEEIERVAPQPGEWEQLSQQHHKLSHAAELIEGIKHITYSLSQADDALSVQLSQLVQRLDSLCRNDPALSVFAKNLQNINIELSEAGHDLQRYLRNTDLDATTLTELDERISLWHATARKLRIPPAEMAERAQNIGQQLQALDNKSNPEALEAEITAAAHHFQESAAALSMARQHVATRLSQQVTEAMQGLNLKGGRFVCELVACEPQAYGLESIEFKISSHPGSVLRPLAKVASGGELARISLAIAVITSQASTVPTLIFDEVDSGIGGAVAEVVGRYLKQLAHDRQVLCVTHLPQVASQGHQHWVVSKQQIDLETTSSIQSVEGDARIQEIARMLGGETITEKTRAAAQEMLNLVKS